MRIKIKAVYGTADMPIEFNDPETGEFAGIARELFQSIENQTGLEFEFIPAATRAEAFGKDKKRRSGRDLQRCGRLPVGAGTWA